MECGIRGLAFEEWTRTVTDRASEDGVRGTPTVLLDGHLLSPAQLEPTAVAGAVRLRATSRVVGRPSAVVRRSLRNGDTEQDDAVLIGVQTVATVWDGADLLYPQLGALIAGQ